MSVHNLVSIVNNPIKVIKIEGNLNDSNSWIKPFAKNNGNIFNGNWSIGLKSFAYKNSNATTNQNVLKVQLNVVKGYEHEQKVGQAPKCVNPPVAQFQLDLLERGLKFKEFENPTFLGINHVNDLLEISFSYYPKVTFLEDILFEATFHYYCQCV